MRKVVRLTESELVDVIKKMIMEQPDSKMPGQIERFGYKQNDPSTFAPALKRQSEYFSSMSVSKFMEGLREFLASGTGFVIQLLLELFPGIGPFINVGAWSMLTIYDIMLGVNQNKWNWFNIIVDICAVVTTGPGGKIVREGLAPIMKFSNSSIEVFANAVRKYTPKMFTYILKLVKQIKSFIGKMGGHLKSMINYLAKSFSYTSSYKGLVKFQSYLSSSVKGILTKIENAFVNESNLVSNIKTASHVAKHAGQHYVTHAAGHTIASTVTGAH